MRVVFPRVSSFFYSFLGSTDSCIYCLLYLYSSIIRVSTAYCISTVPLFVYLLTSIRARFLLSVLFFHHSVLFSYDPFTFFSSLTSFLVLPFICSVSLHLFSPYYGAIKQLIGDARNRQLSRYSLQEPIQCW